MSNSISQFTTDTSTHSVVINPEETISVMDCKATSNIQPVKASSAVKHESYSDKTLLSDNTAITSNTTSKSHVDSTARLLGRIDKILLKLKNNEGIDPREV